MASPPLFLWDHVAAVVFWVALYGVEVALILSVYARYPDSEQAVSAASSKCICLLPPQLVTQHCSSVYQITSDCMHAAYLPAASQPALLDAWHCTNYLPPPPPPPTHTHTNK